MLIANPIHDTAFKRIIEDERFANLSTRAMFDDIFEENRKAEVEQEAWRTVKVMFEARREELELKISGTESALTDVQKQIEVLKRRLGEK